MKEKTVTDKRIIEQRTFNYLECNLLYINTIDKYNKLQMF